MVGIPRFGPTFTNKQPCVPDFTLLTTNSIGIYTIVFGKFSFLDFITKYAFKTVLN